MDAQTPAHGLDYLVDRNVVDARSSGAADAAVRRCGGTGVRTDTHTS